MIKTGASEITYGRPLVIVTTNGSSSAPNRAASPAPAGGASVPERARADSARAERTEELASHLEFVWRFACRMGIGGAAAEDIAQEAFVIALSRIETIHPGKERSYLLSVVVNMVRRERQRQTRHEELTVEPAAPVGERPDQVLDEKRARELLDLALQSLDDDLRAVFVLHEIEEETMADIATVLDLPPGTVASRLRRARDEWKRATARLRSAASLPSGRPA